MPEGSNDQIVHSAKERWDAAGYDRQHSFVWKYGAGVVDLLAPKKGERILDLGCGTGHLTNQIALSGASVVGLDRSTEMIEKAKTSYPGIEFVQANGQDFSFPERFDAVFSNAALHWMRQPALVAARISAALKPGGRLVCEFGAKGNLKAIHGALRTAMAVARCSLGDELDLYFPSIGQYSTLLESHGLAVHTALIFDRLTRLEDGEAGMRRWLEMFASDALKRIPTEKLSGIFESVERDLRPLLWRDGSWYADYRRLRVVAFRE